LINRPLKSFFSISRIIFVDILSLENFIIIMIRFIIKEAIDPHKSVKVGTGKKYVSLFTFSLNLN
jgi:hypothetical protein